MLVGVLAAMAFPLVVWLVGAALGVVQYIRTNATQTPPEAHRSPVDAWEMYDASMEEERSKARERDYYIALLANLEYLQRIVESKERTEQQLRQIIALDKQIHAAQLKLEKLG